MTAQPKLKVAILGSGNIGTDLLVKIRRSEHLECTLFIGRNLESKGMQVARDLGVPVSDKSVQAIVDDPDCCELVFDATSASDHLHNWPILQRLGKRVIDMTPSRVGEMAVPAVNLQSLGPAANVNMVSCGGQASLPIAWAIAQTQKNVSCFEVVSSIASRSAGPATRANIDEYVDTTEAALRWFTGCEDAKAILILNPADPSIHMQTTVSAQVEDPDIEAVRALTEEMVKTIQQYVPGYQLIVPPVYEHDRIIAMVKVTGLGDYLPSYAGNLDIINCAAIAAAEHFARTR